MVYAMSKPSRWIHNQRNTISAGTDMTANRGTLVNVVAWLFTGTAIITVSMKLFARSQTVKQLGWDDFFIFLSMTCSIIAAAFVSYSVTLGLGRHTTEILAEYGPDRLVKTAYWQILGYPSFSFPNISIAILVNHLLDPNPIRSHLLYGMVILQVVFAFVSVFIVFLQCKPTKMLWDSSVTGKCWSPDVLNNFSYWLSAYTTMTDIVLAIVPIMVFWKLQMRFSTKLGVCIMMALTLLSAIVTIIKATYLHLFTDRTDPLYNVVPLVLWGLVEQNVVIVAACIPTLRPFFHKAFKSKSSQSASHNGSSAYQLSSHPHTRTAERLDSISNFPMRKNGGDTESNTSSSGIWRTQEVSIESDEDAEAIRIGLGKGGKKRQFCEKPWETQVVKP